MYCVICGLIRIIPSQLKAFRYRNIYEDKIRLIPFISTEVFEMATVQIGVFWVVTLQSLVGEYRCPSDISYKTTW
jgi:hypothetical protein